MINQFYILNEKTRCELNLINTPNLLNSKEQINLLIVILNYNLEFSQFFFALSTTEHSVYALQKFN